MVKTSLVSGIYYKSVPRLFMLHIWTVFDKNTRTFERSAIEIDERENFQDNFIYTLSLFPHKNS